MELQRPICGFFAFGRMVEQRRKRIRNTNESLIYENCRLAWKHALGSTARPPRQRRQFVSISVSLVFHSSSVPPEANSARPTGHCESVLLKSSASNGIASRTRPAEVQVFLFSVRHFRVFRFFRGFLTSVPSFFRAISLFTKIDALANIPPSSKWGFDALQASRNFRGQDVPVHRHTGRQGGCG